MGNEVYAQPYYIQTTRMSNQVTQPLGANTSYTENFVVVTPATPSPILFYTASGLVTSLAIDVKSNLLYLADEGAGHIMRLDYSGFLQNRKATPEATPATVSNSSSSNATNSSTTVSSPVIIGTNGSAFNETKALSVL